MSLSTVVATTFTGHGQTSSGSSTLVVDGATVRSIALTSLQADLLVTMAYAQANCKRLWLLADHAAILETNSSSAADETIPLQAGIPYCWDATGYFANPMTHTITAFYLTNSYAGVTNVDIFLESDATP